MKKMKPCKFCKRLLPSEDMRLGNKCIWCDNEYWSKKMEEKNGK